MREPEKWWLYEHGHNFRPAGGDGLTCRRCDWYLTPSESVSPFYLQNHGDCPDWSIRWKDRNMQQCKSAQLMLFQDGKHGE
jgi:hypothetical protein